MRKKSPILLVAATAAAFICAPDAARPAFAWGDEGHEVVAIIAQSFLDPAVRRKVEALIASDTDNRAKHDIANEATWADKIKSDSTLRQRTSQWHFVDIEVDSPNLDAACFDHPKIPTGTVAFDGPAKDCIVDKIDEFAAELENPATDPEEQVIALKFLLHFVGDLHQPLHAADQNDRGGNEKRVSAAGFKSGNLHHYWDTEFVQVLGNDSQEVAQTLIEGISDAQSKDWAKGTAADWAKESFNIAKEKVYGQLPAPNSRGSFHLSDEYVEMASEVVPAQLSRAGVRLAFLLNSALGGGGSSSSRP